VYIRAGIYLDFQPIDGLSIKTNFMPRGSFVRTGTYIGEMTRSKAGRPGSSTSEAVNNYGIGYLWENTLAYNKRFGDHSFGATGLFSMESSRDERYQQNVTGLTYPGQFWYNNASSISISGVQSSLNNVRMISYMGRLNYGFKEKYLLTVTCRWDGSSKLAEGNQWGVFPSAAIAWRAVEEDVFKNIDALSNLKFRLSYGVSGLNDVEAYSSFDTLKATIYDWDGTSAKGAAANMANRGLTWEKSHEFDFGIDWGFLNERFSGVIDIYRRTTQGLILDRLIPSHQGILQLKQNVGSVQNQGIEFSINSMNVKNKNFSWQTSLNFTSNKNEIVEIYGDKVDDIGNKLFIGQPVSIEYDYKVIGVWQLGEETEATKYSSRPGYLKVRDIDGDGRITPEKDKEILGSQYPKWTGGMTNTFTYKDLDLSFFFYTRQKVMYRNGFLNDMADFDTRYNKPDFPYWTKDNPTNWFPAPGSPTTYREQFTYEDCSFWRLQHITLGYTFNKQKVKAYGLSGLRAYLQTLNPLVITKAHGWDPEYAREGTGSAPLNGVTFLFGVNISL
jgi:TonB-linked SusC/RagA family outer membrane protein